MPKHHVVCLTTTERSVLADVIAAGTAPARTLTHARILRKADQGGAGPAWPDARIAEALETSVATVARVRRRWVTGGLDDALHRRRPQRTSPRTLDGAQEAYLIALACTEPPPGQTRWSLRLLAQKLVELEVVAGIAPNTVRAVLKTMTSSPG